MCTWACRPGMAAKSFQASRTLISTARRNQPEQMTLVTRWMLALLTIALYGGCAGDSVAPLVDQLRSPDAGTRRQAARALGELGPAAVSAVDALESGVDDPDPGVRQAACRALGEIGEVSPSTTAALQEGLSDPQLSVRLASAFALLKLAPDDHAYVPVLTTAMEQGEGGTIVAVGRMGGAASWALPTLTGLLRDRRPGIRRIAAEALGRIGPDAESRLALQRSAADDPDDRVREAARAALSSARAE